MKRVKWQYIARFLTVLGGVCAIASIGFVGVQIRDTRINQSVDLLLKFDNELNSDINSKIADEIDSPGTLLLKEHGGDITDGQLENYLGVYETLGFLYEKHLITDDMIYNDFSYDVVKAYQNSEVKTYITEIRKDDPTLFTEFEKLAKSQIKN